VWTCTLSYRATLCKRLLLFVVEGLVLLVPVVPEVVAGVEAEVGLLLLFVPLILLVVLLDEEEGGKFDWE